MALTAPSSTLTGQTIASSYDQLLFLDNASGVTEATLKIVSGTTGKTALQLSDEHVLIKGVDTNNAAAFEVQQTDGTSILKVAAGTPTLSVAGVVEVSEYIKHTGDADTSIRFAANDAIEITAGNVKMMRFLEDDSQDMVVINEDSADIDFRVESNGNANMLFVDGGNDRVGIGTGSPTSIAHIDSSSTSPTLEIRTTVSPTGSVSGGILTLGLHNASDSGSGGDDTQAGDVLGQIYFKGQGTDYTYQGGRIACVVQTGDGTSTRTEQGTYMNFSTIDTSGVAYEERMRIDQDGAVQIGAGAVSLKKAV